MSLSVHALDAVELIHKQANEVDARAGKDAATLDGTIELYMKSHDYPTLQDFLAATRSGGRAGQKDWEYGRIKRWSKLNKPEKPLSAGYGESDRIQSQYGVVTERQMVARSKLIKTLLEKGYGVRIPFNAAGYGWTLDNDKINSDFIYQYYMSHHEPPQLGSFRGPPSSYCSILTPNLLASGFSSTAIRTISVFQNGQNPEAEAELKYNAELFKILDGACGAEDHALNGEKSFIDAYKKLLRDYAAALGAGLQQEKAKAEKAKLAKLESDERAIKEKSQASLPQKMDVQNSVEPIALAEQLSALRSGKLKPKTIADAKLLWQPNDGMQIVLQPPVAADSNVYLLRGRPVRKERGRYIFEVSAGNDTRYFICDMGKDSVMAQGTLLKYASESTIVGRFVDVVSYATVAGGARMAPVFLVLLIQN